MKANLRLLVFIVVSVNYLFFVNLTFAFSIPETTTVDYNAELLESIEIYKNFSDTVFEALSELGENNTETEEEAEDDGGSIASLIGVSYILISTSQLDFWPISYPGFDTVMRNITWDMYSAFDAVLYDVQDTLTFSNLMFVPNIGPNSTVSFEDINSRNSMEVISVDFEDDDSVVPLINEKISGLTKEESNYIPEGVLILSSTVAIIFNIVNANLKWAHPWVPIGRKTFNKREEVEMMQFTGQVKVIERDSDGVEVFVFFENGKSGLALRMPKDIGHDRSVANIEEMQTLANATTVTIQMPLLNYTLRSQYNLDDENSTNCDFEKKENMLQLLEVLTYVYVGAESWEMTAISGGQINNVEKYREELRLYESSIPKRMSPSSDASQQPKQPEPAISQSDEENFDLMDTDYSDVNDNTIGKGSLENPKDLAMMKGKSSTPATTNTKSHSYDPYPYPNSNAFSSDRDKNNNNNSNNSGEEDSQEKTGQVTQSTTKTITFDRGFTWLFFDDYVVPITAGVVTSFVLPEEEIPPQVGSFLGMEGSKTSPYIQCF